MKKNGLFWAAMLSMVLALGMMVVACGDPTGPVVGNGEEGTTFPSGFIGTWERAYQSAYTNTLTFTSTTIKSSSQNLYWYLQSVSVDVYTITPSTNKDDKQPITIKLRDGNLEFSNDNTGTSDNDWDGTWKKK